MKRRTIITSVLVIVLCLGLISGSTFALFTSESKVNIAVTSGKVQITATLEAPTLYSADATLTSGTLVDKVNPLDKTGTILPTDPQGAYAGTYYYKQQAGAFANGGTASIIDGKLVIDRITPGDKVATTVNIVNDSNVAIQYRVKVNVLSGLKLYEGLVVKVDGMSLAGVSKTGNWTYVQAPATEAEKTLGAIPVEVYLPLDAGNEYQDLATSMQFTVEAVQGNAKVSNEVLAQAVNAEVAVSDTTVDAEIKDANELVTVTVPAAGISSSTTSLEVNVVPQDTASTITITSLQETRSYDVEVIVTETNTLNSETTTNKYEDTTNPVTIKLFVGTGLTGVKLYHKTSEITNFTYDSTTGYITFQTGSFSEYTVVYNKDIYVETVNPTTSESTITKYTAQEDAGLYQTEDGEFVVVDETTQEISDFGDNVARIGVTGYPTLQAAVDVANAATESLTITILKDFTQETAVGINKNVTIDLAGKTITNSIEGNRMFRVGDASLTILGNKGKVIIPEANIGSYGFVDMRDSNGVAYSNAVLTIKDTYFEGATSAGSFFKFRANGQTMTLENVEANCTKGNGQIYGGYANGENYSIINGYNNQVKLTIIGGEYTYDSRVSTAGVFQAGNYNVNNIVADESDVTLKNVKVVAQYGPILEGHGSVSIDNCDFSISTSQTDFYSSAVSVALEGVATVVNGGNYSATFGAYVFSSGGEIDINGGSFKGTNSVLFAQTDYENRNALINVTDGTFDGKLSAYSYANNATAKIKISGGTFVNTSFEVTGNNASIEISGGTFDCDPTTYVETGCQVKDNEDGTYTVISKLDVMKNYIESKGYTVASTGVETAANNYGFNKNGYTYVQYADGDLVYRYYQDGKVYLASTSNYTGNSLTVDNVDGIRYYAFTYNDTIKTLTINCDLEFAAKVLEENETMESVVFAEGVTKINNRILFKSKVNSVTLPSTLKTIEECAFYQAKGLTSAVIPASVTTIGQQAFAYCYEITSISFVGSPTIDMYYIGRACEKLTDVWFLGESTVLNNSQTKSMTFTNKESGDASKITIHFATSALKDSFLTVDGSSTGLTLVVIE